MSDRERPNPDALLNSIQRDEAAKKRGRLKVFLGMCPGVGKTFAMLDVAQRELKAGRNVVIGYGASIAGHIQDKTGVTIARTRIEDGVLIGRASCRERV